MGQYGGIQRPSRRDDQMPMGGFGIESFDSPSTPLQTFQPGTITTDQMRVTGQPRDTMFRGLSLDQRLPGLSSTRTLKPGDSGGNNLDSPSINKQMNSPEYQGLLKRSEESRGQDKDALGQLEAYASRFEKQQQQQLGQQPPQQRGGMFNQPQQRGGMFNQPQQRGGMFNQQNQFGGQQGQQGMQQMMQFMQQMMQMFSMMGGQNRSPYGGGGYQQPQMQRMMPQQQYQRPQQQYQMPQMQYQPPQMQQQMQRQPQQPSPFAQSIRPRY